MKLSHYEMRTKKKFIYVCAWCKKVRDEEQRWTGSDSNLSAHSRLQVSHGICPDCLSDQLARIPQAAPVLFSLGNTKSGQSSERVNCSPSSATSNALLTIEIVTPRPLTGARGSVGFS